MKREKLLTADGSFTVRIDEMNVTYHSTHGAVQESMHVFIRAGLDQVRLKKRTIRIFEMGFGTGLNALVTIDQAVKYGLAIHYEAVEAFPLVELSPDEFNYSSMMETSDLAEFFRKFHNGPWNEWFSVSDFFSLKKSAIRLQDYPMPEAPFDLIYYDAFAPGAQPELWTVEIFRQLYDMTAPEGILVTYCSKGDVRRAMIAAGWEVEKIPGPPGKREMLRALKQ
jgi:tRNA U34 5-methylaminomethyl-2-thiouridine-forming methyltransferase MnmC